MSYKYVHYNLALDEPVCGADDGYITDFAEDVTCPECKDWLA